MPASASWPIKMVDDPLVRTTPVAAREELMISWKASSS
jgi:hypothetical protein